MSLIKFKKQKIMIQSLGIFMSILFTFTSTYIFMNYKVTSRQRELLNTISTSLKISISENYYIAKQDEEQVEEELYFKLMSIAKELSEVPLKMINLTVLEELKSKYYLSQLAILSEDQDGEDIKIRMSTIEEEIGQSTKTWNYWNNAFKQLLHKGEVDLNRGTAKHKYWVGPKSYSYTEYRKTNVKKYYKFAYYLNENQNYLINGIQAESNYSKDGASHLNTIIDQFTDEIDNIERIAVIDYEAWVNYYNRVLGSNDTYDPYVIFGNIEINNFNKLSINPLNIDLLSDIQTKHVKYKEVSYMATFLPISKTKVVCILFNKAFYRTIPASILLILLFITIIASIIISFILHYENKKANRLMMAEQRRLRAVEELQNAMTNVPDYTFRCRLQEGEKILITYNDGRLVEKDNYVDVEKDPRLIESLYSPSFIDKIKASLLAAFKEERQNIEVEANQISYEVVMIPIRIEGELEEGIEVLCFINDITKYVKIKEKAAYMAYHDELTGLDNRYSFHQDYENIYKYKKQFAVYYLDLDGFKSINDQYGHEVGDYVLKIIGKKLKELLFGSGIYRIGGDEFLAVITGETEEAYHKVALAILKIIREPMELPAGKTVNVGVSIGISRFPRDNVEKETLINYADQAMYEAKRKGKNTYRFY